MTARQRACVDSMSLNAIATPAALEPGPVAIRSRSLAVAWVDSIGWWSQVDPVLGRVVIHRRVLAAADRPVADEDLAGDETVPLSAAGRRVDPLAGHRLNKLAHHTRDVTNGQQQWSSPLLDTSVLPGPEDAPRANARP